MASDKIWKKGGKSYLCFTADALTNSLKKSRDFEQMCISQVDSLSEDCASSAIWAARARTNLYFVFDDGEYKPG